MMPSSSSSGRSTPRSHPLDDFANTNTIQRFTPAQTPLSPMPHQERLGIFGTHSPMPFTSAEHQHPNPLAVPYNNQLAIVSPYPQYPHFTHTFPPAYVDYPPSQISDSHNSLPAPLSVRENNFSAPEVEA